MKPGLEDLSVGAHCRPVLSRGLIEDREDVGEKVEADVDDGDEQHDGLDHGHVTVGDRVDEAGADARVVEQVLR